MEKLIKWGAGNPGALNFLGQVSNSPLSQSAVIFATIEKATTLRGTNLYVLYSDLCNRNIEKVVHLCQKCPLPILEDACSRQDYSGRDLVAPYFVP